ncbi:thioredoxin, putative [Paecilomyces variotii No. 5]|uniref:Thioredoxin, putative n=1 Tax=Byssochlamys spectabilis (strain No. 5 / NBRC 109023) TaxID=1356009 RepID=V5I4G9_BYSSN|nr:thioredoxin, putative [Paecilomyces variotii No. 5]
MAVIEIEVIYDFVCAWCYIGKRNLDRAIALHRKVYPDGRSDIFSIEWRPYYLNYNPHPHSVDKSEVIDERLSNMTSEQRTMLFNRMDQIGRSIGIHFRGGGKIGSTRDAHRLVHLVQAKSPEPASGGEDTTNIVVEKLFEAYHELEMDISDHDVLKEFSVDAGLDPKEVEEWLENDIAMDTGDQEAKQNKDVLMSGVPVCIVQGKYSFDGSTDPWEFLEAFSNARDESQE